MVFNPPTLVNYTSADLYAFERRKIQQYNYYLRYRPEIMSHTYIEISYNSDLQDNNDLAWQRKIKFIVRSRKKFCSQTSCQSHYPRGNTCDIGDNPRVFKTGDHDVEACQYGCYNLYERTKIPKNENDKTTSIDTETENEQYARAPFLTYSYRQCACTVHDNGLFALGIDDYSRAQYHPLPRVDTIGTGFHYIDSGNFFDREDFSPQSNEPYIDIDGNESFRFNLNKYYCDDFQLKFDGKKCYASAGESVFGFLVSSSLYKACQYGVRYAATGVANTDVQKLNLPPVKYKPHHESFSSWKNDVDIDAFFINPNVSLTDLGFTADTKHCIFTTQYGYPGKLVEPLDSDIKILSHDNVIDYDELNKNRLPQFKYNTKTGQRIIDEYEIFGVYKYIRDNPTNMTFNANNYERPDNQLVKIFRSIIDNLGELSAMLTFGLLIDKGLEYSSKLLKLSSEYLEGVITPTLLHIVEREFLTQAFHPTIRLFAQSLAKIARTSTSFIKMADVVTTITGILDLFDIGIDFFNMNKIMDNGTIQQYSELDIAGIRKAYGYGTVEFSPVSFMLMCEHLKLHSTWNKTPNSTLTLRCNSDYHKYKYMLHVDGVVRFDENNTNTYEWISEYIFSLKVNSNGLKINWSDENKLSSDIVNKYLKVNENVYLKGMDEYSKYTESFRSRVKYSQYAILIIVILFLVVIFVYLKLAVPILFISAITTYYIVFSYGGNKL